MSNNESKNNNSTNTGNANDLELPEKLIDEESAKALGEVFSRLQNNVELCLLESPGAEDIYTRFNRQIARELAECSGKIRVIASGSASADTKDAGALQQRPMIVIRPVGGQPVLHMLGAPLGEEGKVLVQAVLVAGKAGSGLSSGARSALANLKGKREILVFGTGTCPYCPGQMILAAAMAAERPGLITSYAIAADQFPELAQSFGVGGVPHTVVNGAYMLVGLLPDEPFARYLASLKKADLGGNAQSLIKAPADGPLEADQAEDSSLPVEAESLPGQGVESQRSPAGSPSFKPSFGGKTEAAAFGVLHEKGDEFSPDLLVLGGGPAGLTAAMYGVRAGLNVTLLDHGILGGQVATTPVVENYPGFKNISGQALVESMVSHVGEYAHLRPNMEITNLEATDEGFVATTSNGRYRGKALILATGAGHRKLGVPGEAILSGRGVHYCASCDGFMYAGKRVLVAGGGNTALTDALHLNNLEAEVTLVHRRGQFRAEQALVNAVERSGIKVVWNARVKEIIGADKTDCVVLEDVETGELHKVEVEAIFVSIGKDPNSRPARAVGAALNDDGTIKVDAKMRTSVPLVYAAGDVNGGFQQIVAAVASGAVAANTAFEDLQKD